MRSAPDFKYFSAMQLIFLLLTTFIYSPVKLVFELVMYDDSFLCVVTKKTIISLYEILKIKQTRINHTG